MNIAYRMTQWLHKMNTEACSKLLVAIALLYETPSPIVLPHHYREFGYSMIHAVPINTIPNNNTVSNNLSFSIVVVRNSFFTSFIFCYSVYLLRRKKSSVESHLTQDGKQRMPDVAHKDIEYVIIALPSFYYTMKKR